MWRKAARRTIITKMSTMLHLPSASSQESVEPRVLGDTHEAGRKNMCSVTRILKYGQKTEKKSIRPASAYAFALIMSWIEPAMEKVTSGISCNGSPKKPSSRSTVAPSDRWPERKRKVLPTRQSGIMRAANQLTAGDDANERLLLRSCRRKATPASRRALPTSVEPSAR